MSVGSVQLNSVVGTHLVWVSMGAFVERSGVKVTTACGSHGTPSVSDMSIKASMVPTPKLKISTVIKNFNIADVSGLEKEKSGDDRRVMPKVNEKGGR
ncbi:MAG: hypothetical protein HQM00_12860 [Magnetococcales bacterium]|nr:hypothetical protein [Magnetococcales bacterium]